MNNRGKLAVFLLACAMGLAAQAQEWPAKPVRVIVPAPPGSSLDLIARTLADRLP
jgi:tripartite-type tricarboxylate transporter receptor subunit TctC